MAHPVDRARKQHAQRQQLSAGPAPDDGAGGEDAKRETDEVQPLTAYARSKIDTERFLEQMPQRNTAITCLRFATACGASPRLRLDLVLNDFVAGALASRRVDVLSDGTPWRPLIDVHDMAR